jgi:hypothetical protein
MGKCTVRNVRGPPGRGSHHMFDCCWRMCLGARVAAISRLEPYVQIIKLKRTALSVSAALARKDVSREIAGLAGFAPRWLFLPSEHAARSICAYF